METTRSRTRPPTRQTHGMMPAARLTVVAAILAVVLAACTGGSKHPSASPTTAAAASTTPPASAASTVPSGKTTLPPGSTTTSTSVDVPVYDAAKNARQDVTAGACTDSGTKGWSLEGKVTNSASTARGYSIAVDFITVPGDTVMATRVVTVRPVRPHATANWSATGAAPGVANLTCVIRQSLAI